MKIEDLDQIGKQKSTKKFNYQFERKKKKLIMDLN